MTYSDATAHPHGPEAVTVYYESTPEEAKAALARALRRRPQMYTMPVLGVLLLVWGLVIRFGSGNGFGDILIILGVADLLTLPLVWAVALRKLRAVMDSTTRGQTVTISPEGLRIQSSRGDALMRWGAFRAVEQSEQFYEFRITGRQSIQLPRRALAPGDDVRVQELLARFGPAVSPTPR